MSSLSKHKQTRLEEDLKSLSKMFSQQPTIRFVFLPHRQQHSGSIQLKQIQLQRCNYRPKRSSQPQTFQLLQASERSSQRHSVQSSGIQHHRWYLPRQSHQILTNCSDTPTTTATLHVRNRSNHGRTTPKAITYSPSLHTKIPSLHLVTLQSLFKGCPFKEWLKWTTIQLHPFILVLSWLTLDWRRMSSLNSNMSLMISTTNRNKKEFCHQLAKQALREKKPAQKFKAGTANFLNPHELFADPRGQFVVKDLNENRVPNQNFTMGEQMLSKRDFKRSDQVWKPNSHSGKLSVFGSIKYSDQGPDIKVPRDPLKVWRLAYQSKWSCAQSISMSINHWQFEKQP